MSFVFGIVSATRLRTCHNRLRQLCRLTLAASKTDFSIISGYRSEEEQNALFHHDPPRSTKMWPDSLHNGHNEVGRPQSQGVDWAPYPDPWNEDPKMLARYYRILGTFEACAYRLEIDIRSGADWNGNGDLTDQNFDDLGHIELMGHRF